MLKKATFELSCDSLGVIFTDATTGHSQHWCNVSKMILPKGKIFFNKVKEARKLKTKERNNTKKCS